VLFAEKVAENNGLQNTYRIRFRTEEYEVTGTEAALQLLQELRAIDELRRISTAKAFTRGLKQSAQGKYETAKEEGLLCAVDSNGVLVVPVSFDYGIWTEAVSQRVGALAGLVGGDQSIKAVEIRTDGNISDRAKDELGKRSIGYKCISLVK
jgi:hypothetical protein